MSQVGWSLVTPSGTLDLTSKTPSPQGYWFETLADGWDLGQPEAVKVIFSTLAADGDDERIVRHGNRTVPFQVTVRGDLAAIPAGERALRLALNSAPSLELRYTPPDEVGAVTVFDVVNAPFKYQPDDLALARKGNRSAVYAVEMTCAPFTRPTRPVTVSMTYSDTAPTVINPATSTAGVIGNNGTGRPLTLTAVTYLSETAIKGTPTVARDSGWSDPYDEYVFASVALPASQPFFAVDVALDSPLGLSQDRYAVVVAGPVGMQSSPIGSVPLGTGYQRFFFAHTLAGSTVSLTIRVRMQQVYNGGTPASYIGGLYATPTAPASGLLIAEVEGSYRAPVKLSISRTLSGALGRTIVFSDPAMLTYGYIPGLAPTWQNAPAGTYTAIIPTAGTVGAVYTLTINGQTSTTRYSASMGGLVFEFNLGARRDGRIGAPTITYTVNGSPTTVPTFYLFRHEPGETALTYLPNVTSRYLFLDSPTLARPEVGVWAGAASNGSDAVSVAGSAVQVEAMTIAPPLQAIWIDSASTGLTATAEYWPRSHTFVPRPAA